MKRIALLTMSIVFLGACAKNGSWNAPAPQTSSEVGTIVSANFEEVDQLVQEQGLKARVISKKQNLYEVFGAEKSQILEAIPNAKLTKNVYFEQLIPNQPKKSARDTYLNQLILTQNLRVYPKRPISKQISNSACRAPKRQDLFWKSTAHSFKGLWSKWN